MRAPQRLRPAMNGVHLLLDLHAQLPQGVQMLVDGPRTDLASAGILKHRPPHPAQHGTQKKDGGADFFGELFRHGHRFNLLGRHADGISRKPDMGPQLFQNSLHAENIPDAGTVM